MAAGDYDGVFADSASPVSCSGRRRSPAEPRLAAPAPSDTAIAELGGKTYIQAWEAFMTDSTPRWRRKGFALIPNTGAFTTSWDTTDYASPPASSRRASPTLVRRRRLAALDEPVLSLVGEHKIIILQNYLGAPDDLATRLYYLANYLLVRGDRSYLDYFAAGPLEWYPEWDIDLGAPVTTAATVADLAAGGAYEREFAHGWAVVNPTATAATLTFPASARLVMPQGGGAVDTHRRRARLVSYGSAASVTLQPATAAIVLK